MIANAKQEEQFHMNASHILIMDSSVENKDVRAMADEMKKEPGVKWVLGLNTILGPTIPSEFVPDKLKDSLITDKYQILLIGSNTRSQAMKSMPRSQN